MSRTVRLIIALVFLAIMVSGIFFFSDQNGAVSNSESSRLARKVAEHFAGMSGSGFSEKEIQTVTRALNKPIRKCAHLFIYFCLGLIICISLHFVLQGDIRPKHVIIAFCIVVAVACADEINQYFRVAREASYKDVMIDAAGGLLGIISYLFIRFCISGLKTMFGKNKHL